MKLFSKLTPGKLQLIDLGRIALKRFLTTKEHEEHKPDLLRAMNRRPQRSQRSRARWGSSLRASRRPSLLATKEHREHKRSAYTFRRLI